MKNNNPKKPPRFAEWILNRILDENISYSASGDIEEAFYAVQARCGRIKSSLWYWFQIMIFAPKFLQNSFQWRFTMVKNYIKIAFRNIRKYKGFSIINLSGLIIGMTCSILILLFVNYEFSYEKFHKNAENIYRILTLVERVEDSHRDWYTSTPPILAPTLKEELPEVVNAAHVAVMSEWMTYKKNEFHENGFCFADQEFLEMFSFPLIAGNPKTALNEPFSLLITEKMAEKYF